MHGRDINTGTRVPWYASTVPYQNSYYRVLSKTTKGVVYRYCSTKSTTEPGSEVQVVTKGRKLVYPAIEKRWNKNIAQVARFDSFVFDSGRILLSQ